MYKSMIKKTVVLAMLSSVGTGALLRAEAAQVPSGVQLAEKQQLVRGNGGEVQSLDPHKIEGVPESNVVSDLFEGLTSTDPEGKVIPAVATHWQTQDQKVWIFSLRPNAKWSNGAPVTAEDFVYSWRRLADPKTASVYVSFLQYAHLANIDEIISGKKNTETLGVKALDAHRLQVTLSEPVSYLPRLLIHVSMAPVYAPAIKQWGDQWTNPGHMVSNGAYQLKSHIVNERIELTRNKQYWDDAHTVINNVIMLPIPSEVNDVNRYLSVNGSDMTYNNLPIELFKKLKTEHSQELKINPYLTTYTYEFNNKRPPFNDVRVRTALKLALDRDIIAKQVLGQGQQPAYSFTHPATDGIKLVPPAWFTLTQQQRNAQAKKLLQEAGYGPNHPLRFSLLYNTSDLHKKLAIAAASIWKKNLGAIVTLNNQEWKTYLDTRHQGNYDVVRASWTADYDEPSSFVNYFLSNSSNNTAFYQSANYDKLVASALASADPVKRADYYQQAEQQLDKDSPVIPVFYYVNTRLIKPWVGGYTGKDPLDDLHDKNLYIIKH